MKTRIGLISAVVIAAGFFAPHSASAAVSTAADDFAQSKCTQLAKHQGTQYQAMYDSCIQLNRNWFCRQQANADGCAAGTYVGFQAQGQQQQAGQGQQQQTGQGSQQQTGHGSQQQTGQGGQQQTGQGQQQQTGQGSQQQAGQQQGGTSSR